MLIGQHLFFSNYLPDSAMFTCPAMTISFSCIVQISGVRWACPRAFLRTHTTSLPREWCPRVAKSSFDGSVLMSREVLLLLGSTNIQGQPDWDILVRQQCRCDQRRYLFQDLKAQWPSWQMKLYLLHAITRAASVPEPFNPSLLCTESRTWSLSTTPEMERWWEMHLYLLHAIIRAASVPEPFNPSVLCTEMKW